MEKKCFVLLSVLLVFALFFAGCRNERKNLKNISGINDLNNPVFTIGCMTGIVATDESKKNLPKALYKEYAMPIDAFTALCAGKIDAVVLDRPTLEYMSLAHPELTVMKEDLALGHISVASAKNSKVLMGQVNEFIRKYRQDGTCLQMMNRWFHSTNSEMPKIEKSFPGKLLKVGVTANNEPLCFVKDCHLSGFDAEFSLRLGAFLKRKVEFVDMPYDALVAGLESGKIDLAVAFMDAIPEREESVLFSENYVDAPITFLIHKDKYKNVIPDKISNLADLNYPNRVIACETEILATRISKQKLPAAKYLEFSGPPDCYTALTTGKAHAVVYDRPPLEHAAASHPEFIVLPENLAVGHISVASAKNKKNLIDKVNEFIRAYRKDGTYQDMYKRWVNTTGAVMPKIGVPERPDGKLIIGITADNPPFASFCNGKLTGFDIEFSYRLGKYLNKKVEFMNFLYDGLLPAVTSGKIDLAIAQMDVTPERGESVLFSEEYVDSPVAAMIRKKDYGGSLFLKFEDLAGKKIGSMTGTAYDLLAKPYLPKYELMSFSQISQQVIALESGKIDAFLVDEPIGRIIMSKRPNLCAMARKLPCNDYAFVFSKKNLALCKAVSGEILKMKKNGEIKKLEEKWFASDISGKTLPEQPPLKKVLKFLAIPEAEPFAYVQNGKIVGFDLELALLAANRLGYKLEIMSSDYSSFAESINSGKCDFAGGCLTITKERQESLLFSEPYLDGGISVMVLKNGNQAYKETQNGKFISALKSLKESFEKTFIRESRWKLILQGLATTLVITFFAVVLGTVLAFPVCMMSRSKRRVLSWISDRYVALIMGTPILVILMLLYYVVFAKVDIDGVFVAILAFALDFAAYTSVTLRSGIDGIPRGQMEAALSLGHTPSAAFFRFVLPQAVRTILPVYRGEIISTLKATSIVGYIAIMDLTKMGDIIRSRTYEAFFPLIAIAVVYFLAAKVLTVILVVFEKKLNPEYRRERLQKRSVK